MRRLIRTLGTLLLILCGVLAGFLGYRTLHQPTVLALSAGLPQTPQPASAAPAPPGAPAPSLADGPAPLAATQARSLPETVPDVQIADLNGKPRSLRQYLGRPLLINFWATWCEPCRREMPLLQQLWLAQRAEGLQVLGVAIDSRSAVQQYLRATSVGYPILADENAGSAAVARFGIEPVLPFSVFADARGDIVAVRLGELHRPEAEAILSQVRAVDTGSQSLPEARRQIAATLQQLAIRRAREAVQRQSGPSAGHP